MHSITRQFQHALEPHRDPATAEPMAAYMRNKFEFLGIKSPKRTELTKDIVARENRPDVADLPLISHELWDLPEREYQYCAVGLLQKMKRELPTDFLPAAEALITEKSWWDTIDPLASHVVGDIVRRHPKQGRAFIRRLRSSENMWLRRTAIIHQLGYKSDTDETLLFEIILENQTWNEFFIQKAIGWALREYSKTNPDAVRSFINAHDLSPLATREGLKRISTT